MEKNLTKTNTIGVSLYTNGNNNELAAQLSEFIAPDGKEAREFIFTINTLETVLNYGTPDADLAVIITESSTELKKVTTILKAGSVPFVIAEASTEDTLQTSQQIILELEKALDSGFTIKDFVEIYKRGITMEKVRTQLTIFRNGIAKIVLQKPATLHDGIAALTKEDALGYASYFESKKNNFKLTKFVPASGAASRMFKFLSEFASEFNPEKESINAYINRKKENSLSIFLVGLDKFPFFKDVLQAIKQNPDYNDWSKDQRYYNFITTMLASEGFDFANKPKGILPFHQYKDFIATPIYEHLKECGAYAHANNQANLHFTISEEHLNGFLDGIQDVKETIEKESGITINFGFSYQQVQTDTLAVNMNNKPFRTDGKLLFRPGGHGALIENMNSLEADIVFIKNIDNVSHSNTSTIALYKKALAGLLIQLQGKIFMYLTKIENNEVTESGIDEIFDFARTELSMNINLDISKYTFDNKLAYVKDLLNRPIRICGMVKNEGEPGGGPFWVEGEKGRTSLQIVESSQINIENKEQNDILLKSTHFNPVDLVCGLKNYKGGYFDLREFVDASTGFIVYKNKDGKDLKSYELPGLWNGSMAGWITVFVEVPIETFNPVKTVNDLLKPAHQPQ